MCGGECVCIYVYFLNKLTLLFLILILNSREWAFSLFRTLKEMVSYANCSFMDNYTMGYQSNLIKLWQLLSLTFLQLVKLWHWGKWLGSTPWGLAIFKASIVYWNVTSLCEPVLNIELLPSLGNLLWLLGLWKTFEQQNKINFNFSDVSSSKRIIITEV